MDSSWLQVALPGVQQVSENAQMLPNAGALAAVDRIFPNVRGPVECPIQN